MLTDDLSFVLGCYYGEHVPTFCDLVGTRVLSAQQSKLDRHHSVNNWRWLFSVFAFLLFCWIHILVLVFWYWLIFRWFWQIRMENSWGLGDSISVAPQIIQIIWPTVRSLAEGWDPVRSSKKLEQCWLQAIDVNLPLPDLPGKNNPFCFRSVWTVQL